MWLNCLILLFLAFVQNIAFSLVSRSRNRSNMTYHVFASIASNGVWFLTFRSLVTQNMSFVLLIPYTIGTVCGSVFGVRISMRIEKWLGAESDSHLKTPPK